MSVENELRVGVEECLAALQSAVCFFAEFTTVEVELLDLVEPALELRKRDSETTAAARDESAVAE